MVRHRNPDRDLAGVEFLRHGFRIHPIHLSLFTLAAFDAGLDQLSQHRRLSPDEATQKAAYRQLAERLQDLTACWTDAAELLARREELEALFEAADEATQRGISIDRLVFGDF